MSFGRKHPIENITSFALVGSPEPPIDLYFESNNTFTRTGNNICFPTTEMVLLTAVGNLEHLKKIQDWFSINTVLLLSFLDKPFILYGRELAAENLKLFAENILKHCTEIK